MLAFSAFFALSVAGTPATPNAKSLYDQKCAACHATDGSGKTAIGKNLHLRDLRSPAVQKQSDQQLYDIIAKGKGAMPGYSKELSKADIEHLIAYVRELAKRK
jgi:mono/diheme cytochrome c family protein